MTATTPHVTVDGADDAAEPAFVERSAQGQYLRSPVDVVRALLFLAVLAVGIVLATAADDTMLGFETDVVGFFDGLAAGVERFAVGIIQLLVLLAAAAALLWPLVTRRWRLLGYVYLAQLVGGWGMWGLDELLDRAQPPTLTFQVSQGTAWVGGPGFPDSAAVAGLAAIISVATPWLSQRYRRAWWALLAAACIGRVVTSTAVPLDLVASLAFGGLVGALVLLVFKAPDRHPPTRAIADALARAGRPLTSLRPASVDARGSTPYFGTLVDGTGVFVKVLGREERSADLLFRSYRAFRFRHIGDERPFSSLRRMIEHEALLALKARDDGVRTPRMVAVVDVDGSGDAMALAYERIAGRSLDSVSPDLVTDEVLGQLWAQVEVMRSRRIAHRDLRLANVFLADDGRPWIIDFGFSELAVSDEQLAADVAQLLASSSLQVGPERAVAAALAHVGPEALSSALARMQPAALAGSTRVALKHHSGMVDELRKAVEDATGTEAPELEPLERFRARTLVMWASLAAAFYFLLPQLADISDVVGEIGEMRLAWLPAIVLASCGTYVGATLSFSGSVPPRLPAGPTFMSQAAGSFVNRVTPVRVGGMAVSIRYAQKLGIEPSVAVAGAGLNAGAGTIVHGVLIGVFALAAGRSDVAFELPSEQVILLAIAGVLAAVGLVFALRPARRMLLDRAWPALRDAVSGARQTVTSPAKLVMLFGGSAVVTLSYLLCMEFSVRAFSGSVGFAAVGFVYLAGSAVGQAAPTPGGLGAVEAALLAGLTAAGMDGAAALSAVIVFRLATFWLPILPGWLAFLWLQRHDYI
jgi:glycosyltransferase 2 family protein